MKATGLFLLLGVGLCCCSACFRGHQPFVITGPDSALAEPAEFSSATHAANAEPDGASDEGKEPDCGSYIFPGCPKILDPVCGTDNLTYPNECELCAENLRRKTNIRIKRRGMC